MVQNSLENNYLPNNLDFKYFCHNGINVGMFAESTKNYELLQLVKNLRRSKSPRPDIIGLGLMIEVIVAIIEPLLCIYNLSIYMGIASDKLKTGKVVAIYKIGDRNLAGDSRPFSLLSVFDKLL